MVMFECERDCFVGEVRFRGRIVDVCGIDTSYLLLNIVE
jgi:hypothetical protein